LNSKKDSTIIGQIGEHLVILDLLNKGIRTLHASEGLPFDLAAYVSGTKLIKIQVKTNTSSHPPYRFRMYASSNRAYTHEVDIFALVSLVLHKIAYIRNDGTRNNINLYEWDNHCGNISTQYFENFLFEDSIGE